MTRFHTLAAKLSKKGSSPRVGRSGRRAATLSVHSTQTLAGHYPDTHVEAMGQEDGAAELQTPVWGENREPHAIHMVNSGAAVGGALIGHRLQEGLAAIETSLEEDAPKLAGAKHATLDAAEEVDTTTGDEVDLRAVCADEGIAVPDHRLRRFCQECLGLVLLAIGDIWFTSLAFEVFGLSDGRLGFLPLTELQLVASSTIIALLLLVRLAGHQARILTHGIVQMAGTRGERESSSSRVRRSTRRVLVSLAMLLLGVAGALAILYGLSGVRAAYLVEQGAKPHRAEFMLIQLGIATAGFLLAYWLAHPYDQEWRSIQSDASRARSRLDRAYAGLADVVGTFNGTLRQREALLLESRSWSQGTFEDAVRKGHMYARRLHLSQREPVTEALFAAASLPRPADSALVSEIDAYLAGEPSPFKRYEPMDMTDVGERLEALAVRRRGDADDRSAILHRARIVRPAKTDAPPNKGSNGAANANGNGNGSTPSGVSR